MRYGDDIVEEVRSANDIVDVVGQYVRLTKKGANYFGLCPFHGEKTASFSVNPQKQIYYCFGCGAGGDVIRFVMEYENYSFVEALKFLAERAHITLPEPSERGESGRNAELKTKLYEINKEAALYFYKQLGTLEGSIGYRYFKEKRRLSDRMITHFGLGFANKTPDDLYRFLKGKGYGDELLKQSGLVTFEERGIHDKFWNRVMFPIMDQNNRVVGFGGRVMGDGMPKYLNSPETPIFDKSSLLYGLNFARKSRKDFMLLCEGYMDVIALHQAGFTNAVASLGTAFNEKHARLLKRYTDKIILTQDSDAAGVKAKLRAFPILRGAGLSVRVLDMGSYKDPDEFIRAEGPDAYESCIRAAKNAFLYEVEIIKGDYDLSDPAAKTQYYEAVAERLCLFEEPLERDNYIQAVSREQMIPYEELRRLTESKILKILGKRKGTERETRYDPDKAYLVEEETKRAAAKKDSAFAASEGGRENAFGKETGSMPKGYGGAKESAAKTGGTGSALSKAEASRRQYDGSQEMRAIKRPGADAKEKAVLKSERLLLSWFAERPDIIGSVFQHLTVEDFSAGIFQETAKEILRQQRETGKVSASQIMEHYAEDGEKHRQIGAILNADATHKSIEEMSKQDFEKALTEAVIAIKGRALEKELEKAGNDLSAFQRLIAEKNRLGKLSVKL